MTHQFLKRAPVYESALYASAPKQNGKLLLLTKQLDPAPRGGRELLCKLNHDVLASIFGEHLIVLELRPARPTSPRDILNAFRGQIDGLTAQTIDEAINRIQRDNVRQVFVDGSNLGGFIASLKRRLKHIEVTCFFHNVETRFFWGALATTKTPRALAVFIANYLAERKSFKFSDKRVCLSERDSSLLKRLYGRGTTHIAPMVMEDKCPTSFLQAPAEHPESFAIFVGGTFYANREGITWFVREVVPRINVPLYIVGRGFEALRAELEVPRKVKVVGAVDSLFDWYRRAKFVIAPIFDGSGMKTKVAEALMYGKKIIGTPEAFSGYEDIIDQAGWVCNNPDEFVAAISSAQEEVTYSFDHALRLIYEQKYSMEAATKRLRKILS